MRSCRPSKACTRRSQKTCGDNTPTQPSPIKGEGYRGGGRIPGLAC
jgi:hypothetical protein